MFNKANPFSTATTSLNSSFVAPPPPSHARTQSYTKMPLNPNNQSQLSKNSSQKKLTLTCQYAPPHNFHMKKPSEPNLKKKSTLNIEKNSHFVSLGSSRVIDA